MLHNQFYKCLIFQSLIFILLGILPPMYPLDCGTYFATKDLPPKKISTRHSGITSYSLENYTTLMIYQNTARGEQEVLRNNIKEKLPSIKVYFQEEEPGCGLFATNSFEHFPERYLLDSYDEPLYFEDIEEAAKCVADIVGLPVEPSVEAIDQALEDYLTEHESDDTWYSFHEFEEVED